MPTKKIFILIVFIAVTALLGCSKEQKAEAPKQEQVTTDLVPPKTDASGQNFSVALSDLKVSATIDTASKEMVDTPRLTANIKITNTSKDILDIQGVTLEYLDQSGKPIAFKSGEKASNVSSYWKAIKPAETFEGSIDATIPRAAVKQKDLGKIEVDVVYVPSPLRRESLTLPEKLG